MRAVKAVFGRPTFQHILRIGRTEIKHQRIGERIGALNIDRDGQSAADRVYQYANH